MGGGLCHGQHKVEVALQIVKEEVGGRCRRTCRQGNGCHGVPTQLPPLTLPDTQAGPYREDDSSKQTSANHRRLGPTH